MESCELLQKLTKAIEKDFKDLKDELIQEKDNSKLLKDTTETLQSTIKELKHDNAGDDGSSTETVSSQEKQHRKQPLKKLSTTKDNKKKYCYSGISPDNIDSKTTTLQDHTTGDKQNKQTTKGNPQRSSSSYSELKTGHNEDKEVLKSADRNTDNMLCPSLTSTPVFTSTQTKLSLNNEVDFPDFSMILNNDGVCSYNKATRENINSQNKDGNYADHDGTSSPSILPLELRMGHDTSSSLSGVKRLQRDSSHVGDDACSVVLLSSDEEDSGKMESSVDMFGEGEKSNKDQDNQKDKAGQKNTKTEKYDDFPGFRKPDEPTFKNVEVVRKKDDRPKLKGFSSFPETQEYMAKGMLQVEDENAPQLPKRKQGKRRLLGRNEYNYLDKQF